MAKFKDLTGLRFDRLLVLNFVGLDSLKQSVFLCLCDCGKSKVIAGRSLMYGSCCSCGCKRITHAHDLNKLNITHNSSNHPIYRLRNGIINRCFNKKTRAYKYYGAKGITVCAEWVLNFNSFFDWCINNGYKKGLQIDRFPNRDGNYEPGNCRFVSAKVNSNNKNNNKRATISGVTRTASEWADLTGINVSTIRGRINRNLIGYEAVYGKIKQKQ